MAVCFSERAILGRSETLGALILKSDAEPSHPPERFRALLYVCLRVRV